MRELFGLSLETRTKIQSVLASYPEIQKVIIYGSRAKGTHRPGSDIDLTLVAPTLTLSDLLRIENQIDDLLLAYKVDLSLYHQIENPELIDHINRVGLSFQ